MYEDENGDSWTVWRKHILLEIQRMSSNLEKLEAKHTDYILKTSVDIGRIKAVSAIYGGTAGLAVTLLIREVLTRI